jgi:hypothetical protein
MESRNILSGVLQGRLNGKRAHTTRRLLGLKDGVVNREAKANEPDPCEVLPDSEG